MSSQQKQKKVAAINNHHDSPLPLITSGISSALAAASGSAILLSLLPILMIKRKMTWTLVEASQVMCGVLIMQ
jgi:hypothetical protein